MEFFKERNKIRAEYSGYGEVSESLGNRLIAIFDHHGAWAGHDLDHELTLHLGEEDASKIVAFGSYDDVFEAIEILLYLTHKQSPSYFGNKLFPDVARAFALSGSVYFVNDGGEICLRTDEETVKNLEEVKEVLSEDQKAYQTFFDAVGNLFGRKAKPEDIIKNIFVAFEDYLKDKTGGKEFGKAVDILHKSGFTSSQQKSLLEKIYAYRSDAYAVGHAGNTNKPEELDALWFLETVIAQLKFIDRKIKNAKT